MDTLSGQVNIDKPNNKQYSTYYMPSQLVRYQGQYYELLATPGGKRTKELDSAIRFMKIQVKETLFGHAVMLLSCRNILYYLVRTLQIDTDVKFYVVDIKQNIIVDSNTRPEDTLLSFKNIDPRMTIFHIETERNTFGAPSINNHVAGDFIDDIANNADLFDALYEEDVDSDNNVLITSTTANTRNDNQTKLSAWDDSENDYFVSVFDNYQFHIETIPKKSVQINDPNNLKLTIIEHRLYTSLVSGRLYQGVNYIPFEDSGPFKFILDGICQTTNGRKLEILDLEKVQKNKILSKIIDGKPIISLFKYRVFTSTLVLGSPQISVSDPVFVSRGKAQNIISDLNGQYILYIARDRITILTSTESEEIAKYITALFINYYQNRHDTSSNNGGLKKVEGFYLKSYCQRTGVIERRPIDDGTIPPSFRNMSAEDVIKNKEEQTRDKLPYYTETNNSFNPVSADLAVKLYNAEKKLRSVQEKMVANSLTEGDDMLRNDDGIQILDTHAGAYPKDPKKTTAKTIQGPYQLKVLYHGVDYLFDGQTWTHCPIEFPYVSFIKTVYEQTNLCLSCCYRKPKDTIDITKKCLGSDTGEKKLDVLKPILLVLDQTRNNKIKTHDRPYKLPNVVETLLGQDTKSILLNSFNIVEARGYIAYVNVMRPDLKSIFISENLNLLTSGQGDLEQEVLETDIEKLYEYTGKFYIFSNEGFIQHPYQLPTSTKCYFYDSGYLYPIVRIHKEIHKDKIDIKPFEITTATINKIKRNIISYPSYTNGELVFHDMIDIIDNTSPEYNIIKTSIPEYENIITSSRALMFNNLVNNYKRQNQQSYKK